MEKRNTMKFTFGIVAIILGATLYKQFNFEQLRFENTGLVIIYIIVFACSVYFLLKSSKNKQDQSEKSL